MHPWMHFFAAPGAAPPPFPSRAHLAAQARRHKSTRGHTCGKIFQKCFVRTCTQVGVLPPPPRRVQGAETHPAESTRKTMGDGGAGAGSGRDLRAPLRSPANPGGRRAPRAPAPASSSRGWYRCTQVGVLPPPQGAFKGAETFKNNTPKQNKIFFIVDKIAKARASAATGCTRKTVRPTKPRPRGDPCEWNLSPPRSLSGSMASRHLFCADQWA